MATGNDTGFAAYGMILDPFNPRIRVDSKRAYLDKANKWKTIYVSGRGDMGAMEQLLNEGWLVVSEIRVPTGCIIVMVETYFEER